MKAIFESKSITLISTALVMPSIPRPMARCKDHRTPLNLFFLYCVVAGIAVEICGGQSLNIATVNIWSGLDYHGVWTIGEHESGKLREQRLSILFNELRALRPDIIALQEVNPVHRVSTMLAESLGYDVLSQRVNAGIKVGGLGIPWNFNEGLAILARKELGLEFFDVWELSSSFGALGNGFSFHFVEQNIALVGKVNVNGVEVFIVNTHLPAHVRADSTTLNKLRAIASEESADVLVFERNFLEGANVRLEQSKILGDNISSLLKDAPVVLVGDFNAEPTTPEILFLKTEMRFLDAAAEKDQVEQVTWDAEKNNNIQFSTKPFDSRGGRLPPLELLDAWYDGYGRRIDYIFLNERFRREDIASARIFLDKPENGLFASDHYGVMAEIDCSRLKARENNKPDMTKVERSFEPLPILSYDTDVGFGYGAKAFLLNQFDYSESFDVVLFNSSKGERWYRLVFSLPDFELRQGKTYPLAFDLLIDYDKWIRNSFFGVGNQSKFTDREIYTREPLEVSATFSRGFSENSVGQLGIRFKAVRNYNFDSTSKLIRISPPMSSSRASALSAFGVFRHDTRDSYINPSRGYVVQGEVEYAPTSELTTTSLFRTALWFQDYSVLFYPKTVLAIRAGVQTILGYDIPVQFLVPIGGNQTLRGFPQDRYLDKTAALANVELRFPLIWRLGGVVGYDVGNVWNSIEKVDLSRWISNPVTGLRFYMNTFVVRLDVGFGSETTGFYLNFGHLF